MPDELEHQELCGGQLHTFFGDERVEHWCPGRRGQTLEYWWNGWQWCPACRKMTRPEPTRLTSTLVEPSSWSVT